MIDHSFHLQRAVVVAVERGFTAKMFADLRFELFKQGGDLLNGRPSCHLSLSSCSGASMEVE